MLIADYTPIIARYAGLDVSEIADRLGDEAELTECLRLPVQLVASDEWAMLYGFPFEDQVPDLLTRHFSADGYPELRIALIAQFLAPFQGVTSIKSEHRAPTLAGDVMVRSHWQASLSNGQPDYSRVVIVDLDVSEWRATERSLMEVVGAKERLTAVIAHELRNPLAAVVGFNSILTSDWEALDDDARYEMVTEIGLQLGDVCTLLDDFLVGSQEALRVALQDVALAEIFDSVDLIGVSAEIDPAIVVRGDPVRIRQIMRNLLRNALRYGGPHIRLGAHKEAGRVAILVLDDGPGVSAEIVDNLFEPFVHGDSVGSLGLGLSVSRGLARQMGGDVTYFRHGPWTVFELELDAG